MTSNRINTLNVVRILCIFVMIINLSFIHFSQARLPNLEKELVIQNPVPMYQLIDVAISNDCLYTTDGYDLDVWNISDNSNPDIISSLDFDVNKITFKENYMYAIGYDLTLWGDQFEIYKINSIDDFQLISSYTELNHSSYHIDSLFFCEENYSYFVLEYMDEDYYRNYTISIIDITDKSNITLLNTFPKNGYIIDIISDEDYLYLLKSKYKLGSSGPYISSNCIEIYDIANKSDIVLLSTINLNFNPKSFLLKDDRLFVVKEDGLNILTMNYPLSSPNLDISSNITLQVDLKTLKFDIHGNIGYLLFEEGILSLDLSDENEIKIIDEKQLRWYGEGRFFDFTYYNSFIYAVRRVMSYNQPLLIFNCVNSKHIDIVYPDSIYFQELWTWFDYYGFGYIICPIIIVVIASLTIYKIIKNKKTEVGKEK